MQVKSDLSPTSFFQHYILRPMSEDLSRCDRMIALVTSIALGILTGGLAHLFAYLCCYKPKNSLNNRITASSAPSTAAHEALLKQAIQTRIAAISHRWNTKNERIALVCAVAVHPGTVIQQHHAIVQNQRDIQQFINALKVSLQRVSVSGGIVQAGGIEVFACRNSGPNTVDFSAQVDMLLQDSSHSGSRTYTGITGLVSSVFKKITINDSVKALLRQLTPSFEID